MNFIPKYTPPGTKHVEQPSGRGGYIPGKFSCDISIESNNVISDLNVSHMMEFVQDESGKKVTIKMAESSEVIAKDVVVSYSTEQIREPCVTLYSSDKYPGEVAAHISFIPRVSDEHERNEENEETKEDDTLEEVDDDADDPEIASGEFIFILDRSGSMRGGRIQTAQEALKLFIKSLPANSKFNIIGFGTTVEWMSKNSVSYTKETIDETLLKIDKMDANLGGTQLLQPLEGVYKFASNPKYPRNIFVLTDGNVSNTDEVINKIREHNHSSRVHSFGIGSGASKFLVKEMATAGLGSSVMVSDNDTKIKAKIIQALKLAAKPAFTDINVDWKDNEAAVGIQVPREPISGNIYEEEPFNIYAILNKADLVRGQIELSFFNTFNQDRDRITLEIDPENIINGGDDDCVFKMAAKEEMDHLKRSNEPEDCKVKDQSLLDLSLKYSVLSEKTAFFGKIKNKDKSGEEMKTIRVPISKMRDSNISMYGMARMPKPGKHGSGGMMLM
jgi:uncharacterized protein YegL